MHSKLKFRFIILTLCLPVMAVAQTESANVKFITQNLYAPKGYSHVAIIDLGNCQMVMFIRAGATGQRWQPGW
jgi:hypothetical protein